MAQDLAQARFWYAKAADAGDLPAEVNLAALMYSGRGGPKDRAKAIEHTLHAAEAGNVVAAANLARMLTDANSTADEHAVAARWSAVAQRHPAELASADKATGTTPRAEEASLAERQTSEILPEHH